MSYANNKLEIIKLKDGYQLVKWSNSRVTGYDSRLEEYNNRVLVGPDADMNEIKENVDVVDYHNGFDVKVMSPKPNWSGFVKIVFLFSICGLILLTLPGTFKLLAILPAMVAFVSLMTKIDTWYYSNPDTYREAVLRNLRKKLDTVIFLSTTSADFIEKTGINPYFFEKDESYYLSHYDVMDLSEALTGAYTYGVPESTLSEIMHPMYTAAESADSLPTLRETYKAIMPVLKALTIKKEREFQEAKHKKEQESAQRIKDLRNDLMTKNGLTEADLPRETWNSPRPRRF